jgi:pimeloyl-ACP methyl ester carboxylesterase
MPEESFAQAFAPRATRDEIALLAAVQRPIALKCIQEPAPRPPWKSKPSWFLIAEEDRVINPRTQRFMAERMGATIQVATIDHIPLLTAPHTVVAIITAAFQSTH